MKPIAVRSILLDEDAEIEFAASCLPAVAPNKPATARDYGTATARDYGTATAGNSGTATAGYRGTATAGDRGTATAGNIGTATAGYRGTATAGTGGLIVIMHWNGTRYKNRIARIIDEGGEGELKPNVKYQLNDNGNFVEATETPVAQ